MARFDNLGQALRTLRRERGYQQVDVARAAHVTASLLSSYETGRKSPSISTLGKILDALGVGLDELEAQLDRVNGRDPGGAAEAQRARPVPGVDLARFLGRDDLPPGAKQAFTEMVWGFQRVARHLCDRSIPNGTPGGG